MDRRAAIKGIACIAGAFALESCAPGHSRVRPLRAHHVPPLPEVEVRPELEVRTVVGLRPFRASGFVVRAEKVEGKLVVHNYGHGGGGIALSWGTAELAARVVRDGGAAGDIAVLGAGAVGLATARLLQERGYRVTIYAKQLPPQTTSNVAAGQCFPGSVFDTDAATPEFMQQFILAAHLAQARFAGMTGARYGAHSLPCYYVSDEPEGTGMTAADSPLRDLMDGFDTFGPGETPFPFAYVRRFNCLMIEPDLYFPALMDDIRKANGEIQQREFESVGDVLGLSEDTVVNCTGLGARALFGDEELVPIKGQLTVLRPQLAVDYVLGAPGLYMFPRSDGILLGGTHERGEWSLEPNLEAKQRIMEGHARLFGAMARA